MGRCGGIEGGGGGGEVKSTHLVIRCLNIQGQPLNISTE